jgi:predicted GH43/DUF377 family glycosyl hydrolase
MEYEQQGFFGNIVSTNGFVAEDDQFTIYYGVSKCAGYLGRPFEKLTRRINASDNDI